MRIAYDTATNEVVIRIPYSAGSGPRFPLSSTGKSHLVVTGSFLPIEGCPDPLKVSINLIHPTAATAARQAAKQAARRPAGGNLLEDM